MPMIDAASFCDKLKDVLVSLKVMFITQTKHSSVDLYCKAREDKMTSRIHDRGQKENEHLAHLNMKWWVL